jgi:hypothetical protein
MVRREGLGSQRVLSGVLAEMHNLVYARFRCIHIGPKKNPSDQEIAEVKRKLEAGELDIAIREEASAR